MTTALKVVCIATTFLGIVTAGVCIWVIASPEKFPLQIIQWDGGDSVKIGIATAILMVLTGIAGCFVDIERLFKFFVAALVVILILAIAFMSVAIKDHGDWKKVHDFQMLVKTASSRASNSHTFGFTKGNSPNSIIDESTINAIMTKLKIVIAVGAVDSITMLVSVILFYLKRPKTSSRNAMQMERTL